MKMRLDDAVGFPRSRKMRMKIKVCGEKWSIYTCDEPYWMGEHSWHVDSSRCMQWGTRTENGKVITSP